MVRIRHTRHSAHEQSSIRKSLLKERALLLAISEKLLRIHQIANDVNSPLKNPSGSKTVNKIQKAALLVERISEELSAALH